MMASPADNSTSRIETPSQGWASPMAAVAPVGAAKPTTDPHGGCFRVAGAVVRPQVEDVAVLSLLGGPADREPLLGPTCSSKLRLPNRI